MRGYVIYEQMMKGNNEFVKHLVKTETTINKQYTYGMKTYTLLEIACRSNNKDIVSYLLKEKAEITPTAFKHACVFSTNQEILKELIKNGAPVAYLNSVFSPSNHKTNYES